MPDCFLTFAERSDSQRRATLATQTELFSEGESSFPSAAWEKTCAAIDENFVFLRGFFREELCLPDQSCSRSFAVRRSPAQYRH